MGRNKKSLKDKNVGLQRADKGFAGFWKSLTMEYTEQVNNINRNIAEYKPAEILNFYDPSCGVYNSIVSGGIPEMRINAILAQCMCARDNNFPVIVLHEGNRNLAYSMAQRFVNDSYTEISFNSPCFEPFYRLDEVDITEQMMETSPKNFDIKINARYYIEGLNQFLKKSKKKMTFKMLSTCPHASIFDKIDNLRLQGKINDREEQEIKSKLMMGDSEKFKIDTYTTSLKREISSCLYSAKAGYKPMNILSAIEDDKILCVDINSVSNKLFLNTLIYQLNLALKKGLQYTVIIDSISLTASEQYADYIKMNTDRICRMLSSDDLYAMTGSNEQIFSSILGNSQISVIMNHTSAKSAEKWAEFLGQYDKYEKSYNNSSGWSRGVFQLIGTHNTNKGTSISKNRSFVVQPEAITRMGATEAYILTAARGELAHLVLSG